MHYWIKINPTGQKCACLNRPSCRHPRSSSCLISASVCRRWSRRNTPSTAIVITIPPKQGVISRHFTTHSSIPYFPRNCANCPFFLVVTYLFLTLNSSFIDSPFCTFVASQWSESTEVNLDSRVNLVCLFTIPFHNKLNQTDQPHFMQDVLLSELAFRSKCGSTAKWGVIKVIPNHFFSIRFPI